MNEPNNVPDDSLHTIHASSRTILQKNLIAEKHPRQTVYYELWSTYLSIVVYLLFCFRILNSIENTFLKNASPNNPHTHRLEDWVQQVATKRTQHKKQPFQKQPWGRACELKRRNRSEFEYRPNNTNRILLLLLV